jgi:hypothetical protein
MISFELIIGTKGKESTLKTEAKFYCLGAQCKHTPLVARLTGSAMAPFKNDPTTMKFPPQEFSCGTTMVTSFGGKEIETKEEESRSSMQMGKPFGTLRLKVRLIHE